jgi:hypothetical protein
VTSHSSADGVVKVDYDDQLFENRAAGRLISPERALKARKRLTAPNYSGLGR